MLHLQVTVPGARSREVLDLLADNVGVANVALLPGCSVKPPGDLILADLARESADEVIEALRQRHIDRDGTISLTGIDTAVSRAAERAERAAPGDSSDAVIWEQVIRTSQTETELSWTFFAFLTIAAMLAAIAIVLDSAVLVVGAMVLGPEFGAIAALAVGIVSRRPPIVGKALLALVAGFGTAIAITTVAALAARGLGWIDAASITGTRPQTGFIVSPDKWSVIVAFIAGVAGMLSLTASKSGALVGVFISVTTVPAAGNAALGLALGDSRSLAESVLQLGGNILAIIVAAALTLSVQRVLWRRVPQPAPRVAQS